MIAVLLIFVKGSKGSHITPIFFDPQIMVHKDLRLGRAGRGQNINNTANGCWYEISLLKERKKIPSSFNSLMCQERFVSQNSSIPHNIWFHIITSLPNCRTPA